MSRRGIRQVLARAFRLASDVTSAPEIEWKTGDVALRRQTHRFPRRHAGARRGSQVLRRRRSPHGAHQRDSQGIDSGAGPADAAVREAAEVITVALSMFAPYTAEEMWERLGYEPPSPSLPGGRPIRPCSSRSRSPRSCRSTARVRDKLEVGPKISTESLEKLARASVAVARAIGDREIVNVIVRAPRLVNIATKPA